MVVVGGASAVIARDNTELRESEVDGGGGYLYTYMRWRKSLGTVTVESLPCLCGRRIATDASLRQQREMRV